MRSKRSTSRLEKALSALAVLSLCLLSRVEARADSSGTVRPAPGGILILNSYHPGYTWSDHEVEGLLEVLSPVVNGRPLWVEYLDAKSFPAMAHEPETVALYRTKYGGRHLSLVVLCDDPALEFARAHRDELWPGVPVVFCGINGYTPEKLAGLKPATGVAESLDIGGTLEAALGLCPGARTVVVLHDSTVTGLGSLRDFEAAAPRFGSRVRFQVLPEMAVDALLGTLERLGADVIVLALSYSRDAAGRVFDHSRIAELLAGHSAVPVFVVHGERLGRGVVGGILLGGTEHGREAGRLALRVLGGESAGTIPVARGTSYPEFDYEGLERWRLDPSKLPEGARVINVPESFYRRYRSLVWGTAAVVLGLSAIVVVLSLNIVRRRRAERAVQEERRFVQSVLDRLPDPVLVFDAGHVLKLENEAAHALAEGASGSTPHAPLFNLTGAPCPEGSEPCPVREALGAGGAVVFERRQLVGEGETRTYSVSAAPLPLLATGETGVVVSAHDVTALKRANLDLLDKERRLDHLAHHDALTGLPNRLLFHDRFQQAIARARRAHHPLALLFLDLDRFKNVNDSLGHETGDELLTAVGLRLRECVRDSDTVARLGGDEFAVLLDGPTDAAHAATVARKTLGTLGRTLTLDQHEVFVGASIGIAVYPDDGGTTDDLLKHADAAMYLAKERGRGNYQFFTEVLNARVLRQVTIEKRLRHALAAGALEVHFQPIVSLSTGRIVAGEALLRWTDEELGAVGPAEFVPIAEESGLIGAIGEGVLRIACRAARGWQLEGFGDFRIAVNVSARQFWQREILGSVERALSESSLPASSLELELTESVLLPRTEDVRGLLDELGGLGVRLSVDDFGTGYSSLGYLKRLPLDTIKVAQDFVRDLSVDPNDAAIVEAVLSLARTLGFDVVAEGVETAEHVAFFREHGCDLVQGHYFGRAVPEREFGELLRAGARPACQPISIASP
ncbi:MAG: EAL domain-containing protein [Holophagales bacterium]|nr:EAL domain-containing protein [Holophagales bacterium]